MIKKNVTIFGKDISVVLQKGLLIEHSAYGYYDPEKCEIHVDADLPPTVMQEAFLHECGHALFHRAGLSQSKLGRDLEEIIVEQFSIMFSENFLPKKKARSRKKR